MILADKIIDKIKSLPEEKQSDNICLNQDLQD